jgi:hypothetical protein
MNFFPFFSGYLVPGYLPKYHLKIDFEKFCELLFHFLKINSKKRFLGSMNRSKLCENGPEIVEKKNTVAHSIPEKKSLICPGYYMRGLPVKKNKKFKKTDF